jgi:MFS family permease
MSARVVVSPVVPDVVAAFDVSNALVGLVLTTMWGTYALASYPSGVLADRLGERTVVLWSVGLAAVGSLALALAPAYPAFLAAAAFLGVGAGLYYPAAVSLLGDRFADLGRVVGLHLAGSQVAGLVAPVLAAVVAARYGWRPALLVGAGVALPLLVLFRWRVRATPPAAPERSLRGAVAPRVVLAPLRDPRVAFLVGLAGAGSFVWQATAAFLPTFLVRTYGLGTTTAGALLSVFFVTLAVATPASGWLSDRVRREAAAGAVMTVGVAGFAVLVLGSSLPAAVAGAVLVGVGMAWPAPVESRMLDAFPETERGRGFGVARGVYLLVGALGSVAAGALADLVGWTGAFSALGGLLVVLVALVALDHVRSRVGVGADDGRPRTVE